MDDDVVLDEELGWTVGDQRRYWEGVDVLAVWYQEFFARKFQQVHAGSGDTLSMLEGLRERIQKEGLETVANFGFAPNSLFEDEYTDKYSEICDIVERTYQGMPLEHCDEDTWRAGIANNDPLFHTSKEARAVATKIFEILDVTLIED